MNTKDTNPKPTSSLPEVISLSEVSSVETGKQARPFHTPSLFYDPESKIPTDQISEDKIDKSVEAHDFFKKFLNYTDSKRNLIVWYTDQITFNIRFDKVVIEQNLSKIKKNAEEFYKRDNEIDRIDEKAYRDIKLLLNTINKVNPRIPMPEIDWADDGSLNTTWVHKKDIITMEVYGNNAVIFAFYFEEKRQASGVCEISDISVLSGFLKMLDNILHE